MLLSAISSAMHARTMGALDVDIQHLLTDSRELGSTPADTLFFALATARRDGAQYVPSLIEKGVRAFVLTEQQYAALSELLSAYESALSLLIVEDTLMALQDLAAYKRSLYPDLPVIGITGSNGKTVVKEWLYQLLKDDYRITRSPRSYNSQIGVALSVWLLSDETELAIFEAGISEPGEMERLERMIRPTVGVITYIGEEHGENFLSLEQKREEKMRLFTHCPTVIEDATHQNVRTCAGVLRALGYAEEEIQERLMQKTHETVMRINLTALAHNVHIYKSLLLPETKLCCMVKAFAYGAGHTEVSRCLQDNGADYLAVAVADEGVELRQAGIHVPVIIMDPEVSALHLIMENNLEPNIYSFEALENIIHAAEQEGMDGYPIHIKIDSGMHRLGFEKADMPRLIERLLSQKAVRVRSVFSHLAGADEERFADFTHMQIERFSACADMLREAMPYPVMKHILNSAGIEHYTDYQYDMCRLGIGLYGFSFYGLPLRQVCSLSSTILSVKTVHAGESVGYSRKTMLTEDRQVAVIPIGYADGFDRRLGNGAGHVLVRGQRCPILGNVCMDLCMIDVTGTDAAPGDEALIFGERLPLEEMAQQLGTITYEILTSVSRRVKRIYYWE